MREWVIVCLTIPKSRSSLGVRPRAILAACGKDMSTPASSMLGNSQKCAFTASAGRWRTKKRPRFSTTKAANRRVLAGVRSINLGRHSTFPVRRATQRVRIGQTTHFGCLGVQTRAPSSMSAWFRQEQLRSPLLQAPELSATRSLAKAQSCMLTVLFFGLPWMQKKRVSTRITLPSKIGAGWLKAMLQMAPAV